MKATVGEEVFNRIKGGEAPGPEIFDRVRQCVEQKLQSQMMPPGTRMPDGDTMDRYMPPLATGMPKPMLPPTGGSGTMSQPLPVGIDSSGVSAASACIKQTLGEEVFEKIRTGEILLGPEIMLKIRHCFSQLQFPTPPAQFAPPPAPSPEPQSFFQKILQAAMHFLIPQFGQ